MLRAAARLLRAVITETGSFTLVIAGRSPFIAGRKIRDRDDFGLPYLLRAATEPLTGRNQVVQNSKVSLKLSRIE